METQKQIAVLVEAIAHQSRQIASLTASLAEQSGQTDALTAALLSTLHAARATPGLPLLIESRLEQGYSGLLARSESPEYVGGFERMRDLILIALKQD
ncbi:hypothetical protein [Pigmentiphaga litoralis]|uniref:Uncharacterized protein n=1 Tax=Pigmentiphaga litoralis TaxID=516702 RepID=A0A7Y9IU04_9BURK|nr:hypothetical protein [Pigmentiphaga litoralis]NYE23448.1 hypothetical protein [Pigmentiphaga litoralis]NYE82938.1 hypothetical protein [Pigmentiphaga litoralis]